MINPDKISSGDLLSASYGNDGWIRERFSNMIQTHDQLSAVKDYAKIAGYNDPKQQVDAADHSILNRDFLITALNDNQLIKHRNSSLLAMRTQDIPYANESIKELVKVDEALAKDDRFLNNDDQGIYLHRNGHTYKARLIPNSELGDFAKEHKMTKGNSLSYMALTCKRAAFDRRLNGQLVLQEVERKLPDKIIVQDQNGTPIETDARKLNEQAQRGKADCVGRDIQAKLDAYSVMQPVGKFVIDNRALPEYLLKANQKMVDILADDPAVKKVRTAMREAYGNPDDPSYQAAHRITKNFGEILNRRNGTYFYSDEMAKHQKENITEINQLNRQVNKLERLLIDGKMKELNKLKTQQTRIKYLKVFKRMTVVGMRDDPYTKDIFKSLLDSGDDVLHNDEMAVIERKGVVNYYQYDASGREIKIAPDNVPPILHDLFYENDDFRKIKLYQHMCYQAKSAMIQDQGTPFVENKGKLYEASRIPDFEDRSLIDRQLKASTYDSKNKRQGEHAKVLNDLNQPLDLKKVMQYDYAALEDCSMCGSDMTDRANDMIGANDLAHNKKTVSKIGKRHEKLLEPVSENVTIRNSFEDCMDEPEQIDEMDLAQALAGADGPVIDDVSPEDSFEM